MTTYDGWSAQQLKGAVGSVETGSLRRLAAVFRSGGTAAEQASTGTRGAAGDLAAAWHGQTAVAAHNSATTSANAAEDTGAVGQRAGSIVDGYADRLDTLVGEATALPATPPPNWTAYIGKGLLSPVGAAAEFLHDSNKAEAERKALVAKVTEIDMAGDSYTDQLSAAVPRPNDARVDPGVPSPRLGLQSPASAGTTGGASTTPRASGSGATAVSSSGGAVPAPSGGEPAQFSPAGASAGSGFDSGAGASTATGGGSTGGAAAAPTGVPTPTGSPAQTAGPTVPAAAVPPAPVGATAPVGAPAPVGSAGAGLLPGVTTPASSLAVPTAVAGGVGMVAAGAVSGAGGATGGLVGAPAPLAGAPTGVGSAAGLPLAGSPAGGSVVPARPAIAPSGGQSGSVGRPSVGSSGGQSGSVGRPSVGSSGGQSGSVGRPSVSSSQARMGSAGTGSSRPTTIGRESLARPGGSAGAAPRTGAGRPPAVRPGVLGDPAGTRLGSARTGQVGATSTSSAASSPAGRGGASQRRRDKDLKGRPDYLVTSPEVWGDGREVSTGLLGERPEGETDAE